MLSVENALALLSHTTNYKYKIFFKTGLIKKRQIQGDRGYWNFPLKLVFLALSALILLPHITRKVEAKIGPRENYKCARALN
jgi:hypothetical protein